MNKANIMKTDPDIQSKKIELIQWLSTIDDISVLNEISEMKNKETKGWWDKISEPEKQSVLAGIADADSGKLNSHGKAKAIYEKWL